MVRTAITLLFFIASMTHAALSAVWINEIMASNKMTALDPDSLQYGDWIEIYNSGPFTIDLSGAYLTDDLAVPTKWRIPNGTTIPVNGYLLIWADGNDAALKNLHTNFKLDNDGETVGLYAADGTVVDTLTFKKQFSDISLGRDPKDPHRLLYFEQPTPGKANASEGYLVGERAGKVKFSLTPGFYRGAQAVLLSAGNGATIRYTLDGSTPTRNSKVYQSPLVVTRTTVIKARAYEPGLLPGPVETCTLFIDEESTLPVISISTESANLFSDEYGIYVDRNINARKNWERPAVLEFFESNGIRQFAETVDLRLFGRTAIYIPQKSLAVFLNDTLIYPLFPGQAVQTFQSFILRSSSDDWHRTMFRDGFIQTLMRRSLTINTQAYRPSVVFINGEYYGIHNIREKYNGDYLASYHGVDPDSLDLLYIDERQADPVTVLDGDRKAYDELIAYISSHDLAQAEHYAWVAERVDIDNFIDYIIAEAFTGNTSWAHNIRCWRPRTPDGKWQWLLFDMDRGFRDRNFNTWADMAEKFELFRNLLKNNEFRQRLIARYAELINSAFQPEAMTALLDSLRAGIAAEMPRHIERWKDYCGNGVCGIPSMTDWQNNVNDMRSIVQARPTIATQQLVSLLNLGRQVQLTVQVQQPNYGEVQIGRAKTGGSFTGIYFPGMQVVLHARPNPGFTFTGWYGASASKTLLLPRGSTWRYFDQNNRPTDNWYTAGYNDSSWKSGRAQLGYGENDEATVIDYGPDASHKYMTAYFRTVFTINDVSKIKSVLFKLLRDDGAVVYLNGVELFRSNMPEGEVQHSTPASSAVGGADESTFFEFSFPGSVLVNGSNLIAVEIHQNSGSSSDLSFDLEIEAEQLGGDQTISMEPELTLTLDGDRSLIAAFQPESSRVLPNSISGTQTLTAGGSPYLALGSVTVEANAVLKIEAGAELRFAQGADLIVRGKLEANGTAEAPVAFRGIGGGKWGAVCFDQAGGASMIAFALIQGATTGADAARFNAAVAAHNTDLTLDHVTINHCRQPFNAVGGNVVLVGCTFDGTGAGDDILHVQNASARIESCRLFGNGELDFDSVDDGIIRNSVIEIISDNANRDGIDIGASKNVLIEGNRIFNTPDKGISVGEKSLGTLIRRNLIVNAAIGVAVKDASESTVDHCTFYDCRTGLALYEKTSGQGGGRAVVSNSIFAGRFDLEAETLNQSDVHFSYCLSEKSLPPGEGNLKGEAQFVDPLHGNFNLLLDSPCIDAGDPSAPLDPDGTRSDIGAYAYHFGPAQTEGLVINEVMADNTSTLADEAGEFDDWIELYNGGNEPIDIAGLYVTDDAANPTKHRIAVDRPEQTTIPAKGFLLLWADGNPEQGALHLNFKLRSRGEKVAFVKINRTSVSVIDSVTFASMAKDASWGRFPDGEGEWRLQYKPTPGAANQAFPAEASALQVSLPEHFALHPAFPNPFNSQTVVLCELPQSGQLTVEVFNVLGKRTALLLKEKRDAGVHRLVWDGRNEQGEQVPSGVYYLRATMGEQVAYVKMALIR